MLVNWLYPKVKQTLLYLCNRRQFFNLEQAAPGVRLPASHRIREGTRAPEARISDAASRSSRKAFLGLKGSRAFQKDLHASKRGKEIISDFKLSLVNALRKGRSGGKLSEL